MPQEKINKNKKKSFYVYSIIIIFLTIIIISYLLNDRVFAINTTIDKIVSDTKHHQTFNLLVEKKESSDFTSSIILPKTNIEEVDNELINWSKDIEKEFLKDIKKSKKDIKKDQNDYRAHLNIQTKYIDVTDDLTTIVLTVTEFTYNEKTKKHIKPIVVSLEKGKKVNINELLNFNKLKSDNHLSKLVDNELKKDSNQYNSIDRHKVKELLETQENITWGLNDTELLLYFQETEVAPKNLGKVTVNIPIEQLVKYMDVQLIQDMNVEELIQIAKEKEEATQRKIAKKKKEEQRRKERKENLKELDPTKKYVAITFDDGPNPEVTPGVLDYLDQYDAVATFYMLGKQAESHPDLAKNVADRGHEIASHSMTHDDLTTISTDKVSTEILNASLLIEQATGVKPETFRPPYGAINQNVTNKAIEMNQPIVLWSVDSFDWKYRNKKSVHSLIMKDIHPGAIVLMHDIHPSTADALPSVLKSLKNQGYEFVIVTDLLQLKGSEDIGPYNSKKTS